MRRTSRRTNRNQPRSRTPRRSRIRHRTLSGPCKPSAHSQRGSEMNDFDQARNAGERRERRGFASMSPEKQREIASKGGRAAHQKGTAHEWTSEEARSAGRKGGQISRGGRGRLVENPVADAPHESEYNGSGNSGRDE